MSIPQFTPDLMARTAPLYDRVKSVIPSIEWPAFAADIDNGTHTVPDFADAVRRHEVIAAIERSAASGERVKV